VGGHTDGKDESIAEVILSAMDLLILDFYYLGFLLHLKAFVPHNRKESKGGVQP
jgi:hypothetical protein